MINRIRDIRRQKGWTLADLAAACDPPTTAQTIGRLETGMRNLSLSWMNRIGAALGVDPETLVKGEKQEQPQVIARLTESGAESLSTPRDAILPTDAAGTATFPLTVPNDISLCGVEFATQVFQADPGFGALPIPAYHTDGLVLVLGA